MDPYRSQATPAANLPMAGEALKPETIPAPVDADIPIDWAKSARKYGGTKSGNAP